MSDAVLGGYLLWVRCERVGDSNDAEVWVFGWMVGMFEMGEWER